MNYFEPDSSMIFLDEPPRLREKGEAVEAEFRESMSHRLEKDICFRDRQSCCIR